MRGDDPRAVNVRSRPRRDATKVDQLQIGERFQVLAGPSCNDGLAWFRVSYGGGGLEGWIAEGDATSYFVSPDTSAAQPASTPTPSTPGRVLSTDCRRQLLVDDFAGGTSRNNWFQGSGNRSRQTLVSGAYRLTIGEGTGRSEPVTWGDLQDFRFDVGRVEAVMSASKFTGNQTRLGLWLRYQDEEAFIAFMLRSDGTYRVSRWQGNGYTDLLPWTPSDAIRTGDNALNTVRVDMGADTFDLYINGQYLTTVTDNTWPEGGLAFFGSSSAAPLDFDLKFIRICGR